jgi:NTP pyrophosphatase (non-canonical NTP hydrolase)
MFHNKNYFNIMKRLIERKVIEWANERGLIKEENAPKQFIKLTEEVGELASALLKKDPYETIDAIGDIQVVLIILCEQLGINMNDCLESAYNEIKERKGKTINGTFIRNK